RQQLIAASFAIFTCHWAIRSGMAPGRCAFIINLWLIGSGAVRYSWLLGAHSPSRIGATRWQQERGSKQLKARTWKQLRQPYRRPPASSHSAEVSQAAVGRSLYRNQESRDNRSK